jgi:hypothetical protein
MIHRYGAKAENGHQALSGRANRPATMSAAAGLKPSPLWLPTDAQVLRVGGVLDDARLPMNDGVAAGVDGRHGHFERLAVVEERVVTDVEDAQGVVER